jgi:hypothetical protein
LDQLRSIVTPVAYGFAHGMGIDVGGSYCKTRHSLALDAFLQPLIGGAQAQ